MGAKTTKNTAHAHRWLTAGALCAALLTGCGGSSSGESILSLQSNIDGPLLDPTLPELAESTPDSVDPIVTFVSGDNDPVVTAALAEGELPFDDPTNLGDLGSVVTTANTGLRVGFAIGLDPDTVDISLVEDSWTGMQNCLKVVAASPLVVVSNGPVLPMSSTDDILFHIDGSITATSTRFLSGATIQVDVADLDGSLNQIGFNLRSIIGRYLWASANLPERDYPHSCASQR